ncbi:WD40-repeat-containing domain protein [Rhodocollybia butyracea]|uniref:WD40-repeat-containing domain protein n=1 Tax=Rhodocollybia butyracea TaxID=206335 RepID=A0A9P5U5B5_9AGAR|nr:WD40-repeat-containing domain protein [Rhodocollybia butyracea]
MKIVSGSDDNSVRIWNADTQKAEGNPLQGHTNGVNSVAFSPDGKKIVSGSSDNSVRIWNVETGMNEDQLHTLRAFSSSDTPILVEAHTHTSDTSPIHDRHAYTFSLCPLHNGHHSLHSSPSFHTVSLRPDGWLCSSDSSLILWIPPEYRYGLSLPRLQMLISSLP